MFKKAVLFALCIIIPVFAGNTWTETTQGDFADGAHENTIYASHRSGGAVEFVPRFDLNNDGYNDLIVVNSISASVSILQNASGDF